MDRGAHGLQSIGSPELDVTEWLSRHAWSLPKYFWVEFWRKERSAPHRDRASPGPVGIRQVWIDKDVCGQGKQESYYQASGARRAKRYQGRIMKWCITCGHHPRTSCKKRILGRTVERRESPWMPWQPAEMVGELKKWLQWPWEDARAVPRRAAKGLSIAGNRPDLVAKWRRGKNEPKKQNTTM